jgi:hypothetical protein
MQWEEFKNLELSPDERQWEYDGDGTRIYKLECGFGAKTPWDGGYLLWEKQYGYDWEEE